MYTLFNNVGCLLFQVSPPPCPRPPLCLPLRLPSLPPPISVFKYASQECSLSVCHYRSFADEKVSLGTTQESVWVGAFLLQGWIEISPPPKHVLERTSYCTKLMWHLKGKSWREDYTNNLFDLLVFFSAWTGDRHGWRVHWQSPRESEGNELGSDVDHCTLLVSVVTTVLAVQTRTCFNTMAWLLIIVVVMVCSSRWKTTLWSSHAFSKRK